MNYTLMFMRLPQVEQYTCLSKSTIYRLIDKGEFPRQVSLSSRSVVWVKSQIDEWCSSKIKDTQS